MEAILTDHVALLVVILFLLAAIKTIQKRNRRHVERLTYLLERQSDLTRAAKVILGLWREAYLVLKGAHS